MVTTRILAAQLTREQASVIIYNTASLSLYLKLFKPCLRMRARKITGQNSALIFILKTAKYNGRLERRITCLRVCIISKTKLLRRKENMQISMIGIIYAEGWTCSYEITTGQEATSFLI